MKPALTGYDTPQRVAVIRRDVLVVHLVRDDHLKGSCECYKKKVGQ